MDDGKSKAQQLTRWVMNRGTLLFIVIAIPLSFLLTQGLVGMPAYPDAYYHFNVANRLVVGDGFVDDYLWMYIGAPDNLPAPSHLYWMPMTSIIAGMGMGLFNAPDDYASAQFFFALMVAGAGLVGYQLAFLLKGNARHAWLAGLLTIIGGYFAVRWGTMDTFAPYALIGSLALLFIGLGMTANRRNWVYWILAGVFAGLGHLTRADGLILIMTSWAVLLFPFDYLKSGRLNLLKRRMGWLGIVTICYVLTMTPWFMRNLNEIGTILPVGGTQSIWFTEYNELFNYPPDASPERLFADGLDTFIDSRWLALTNNLGTFVAVEGLIIFTPFMLIGIWKRRYSQLIRGFWIFAIGIHVAMTFVFPFPGYRGGLFHAVSALVPFWMVMGFLGLDDTIDWIAKWRRTWRPRTAKPIFSILFFLICVALTWTIAMPSRVGSGGGIGGRVYAGILEHTTDASRIMINDPAQLYHFIERGGVAIPNASVDVVPEIADKYEIDYLLIEFVLEDGTMQNVPSRFRFNANNPPDFLQPIPFPNRKDVRLYEIILD